MSEGDQVVSPVNKADTLLAMDFSLSGRFAAFGSNVGSARG